MDIARIVDEYAVWHEVSGHSPKTIALYRWALGAFRAWLVKHDRPTAIDAITIADVRAFLQSEQQRTELYRSSDKRTRAGRLSDRTIHVYARSIRAFFHWLVDEGRLSTNPMARLKPPKLEKRYKEILNVAEMERLLAELNPRTFLGSRMYAMIALLYDSGLRASELTGINVGDIEWGSYQVRVMGKGKQERLVPFSPTTQRALRKYLTLRERFAFDDTEALFINVDGRRFTA